MFSFFKKKKPALSSAPLVDIHSHLLPDLDDGVEDFNESIDILRILKKIGYKKVITTPHIMGDFYKNNPEAIRQKLLQLKSKLTEEDINIEVEAAAEYNLDDHFMDLLANGDELLTFGKKYILVETAFFNKPAFLFDAIFKINAMGLTPILAHPERYLYVQENPVFAKKLIEKGMLLQLNLGSLIGLYSIPVKKLSIKMIHEQMIQFLGTDIHSIEHAKSIESCYGKIMRIALQTKHLNNSLF